MTNRSVKRSLTFDRHVAEETYGPGDAYGVPPGPLPAPLFEKMGKAILSVVAADGRASEAEIQYLTGLARALGAPKSVTDSYRTFDPKTHRFEETFDATLRPMARVVLYDAIRTARVDGFAQKEREEARRGAAKLGLEPELVSRIEGLLAAEDGVRQARLSVVLSPDRMVGPGPTTAELGEDNEWWRYEQHGLRGPVPAQMMVKLGKAILKIASGDGMLTEAEEMWFYGMGKALGAPQPALEEVMKWDPASTRLEELIDDSMRPFARMILYDAVRCAAS